MRASDSSVDAPHGGDPEVIRTALRDAHVPSLMVALAQLTGDFSFVREAGSLEFDFFGDGQGGLDEGLCDRVRESAEKALTQHLATGRPTSQPLPDAEVFELMTFLAGREIPQSYVPLLREELALEGGDPKAGGWLQDLPAPVRSGFHVVVIGAGMSGLAAAVRLRQAGIPFTVVEKNADVGGTWFENTYPGCRVDTPNHLYGYSFEPLHDWPQHYSTQDVLLDYFRGVADRHDLRPHIRFQTSVEEARWDDATSEWNVRVRDARGSEETLRARAVISAVGQLNLPRFPEIPGRERFRGPAFHSARWDHACDLAGKRVAVIGTGASAFQFVPEIAEATDELLVFQRSAPWLGPTPDYHDDVPEGMKWLHRNMPGYARWYRFWLFWMLTDGLLPAVSVDPEWKGSDGAVSPLNDMLRHVLTERVREQVGDDPDLFAASVPDYPPGAKRMLRDNGVWLAALRRNDVRLVTTAIREIDETGLVTVDGEHHAVDVIIYGTGFQASEFLAPMRVTGLDGLDLHDHWGGDARAYLGMSLPGFPNLFMMYGPNTNIVVNGSIIFFSECEVRYILGCIDLLLRSDHRSMTVKPEVHDVFNRRVDDQNARMAWGVPGVSSWYKNRKGRVSQNWPFALVDFWKATRRPNPDDFELR